MSFSDSPQILSQAWCLAGEGARNMCPALQSPEGREEGNQTVQEEVLGQVSRTAVPILSFS